MSIKLTHGIEDVFISDAEIEEMAKSYRCSKDEAARYIVEDYNRFYVNPDYVERLYIDPDHAELPYYAQR